MVVVLLSLRQVTSKQGEEVNYVEQVSELASYLENAGQEDYNKNWTAQLK